MRAAWFQFRVDFRSRWRAWTAIGVLAGIATAVVLVAVAGARRTNSSLHRVVVDNRAADLFIGPNNGLFTSTQRGRIEHLPQVAEYAYVQGVAMAIIEHGKPNLAFVQGTIVLTNADGHDLHDIDRPGVVAGRIPRPDESRALVVNEAATRKLRLHLGSALRVGFADVRDLEGFDGSAASLPKLREFTLTVVGIVRPLIDATRSADDPRLSSTLLLSPSLSRSIADLGGLYDGLFVRLHEPGQLASFKAASRRVFGSTVLDVQELNATIARSRRAIRPYVLALWLFGAFALLAGTAVIGQLATRQRRLESAPNPTLRALGATRAQLVGAATLRGLFMGWVSSAVAAGGAIALSPLMPIGPLRVLEPHRGVDVDLTVVLIGALTIVFGMTVYSAVGAIRRPRPRRRGRHRVGDAIAGSGAPAPVVAGVRLALDPGRGEAAIPVASTMFGVGLAVAALVATIVYASALTHFTSTPRLFGWVWSYQIEPSGGISTAELDVAVQRAARDPDVRAAAVGAYGQLVIGGETVGAIAVQTDRGIPVVEVVRGREPRRADEICLGTETLRVLGHDVGDNIEVGIGGTERRFKIVGRAVFPRFAPYSASEPTGLGVGAAMSLDGLARFGPLDDEVRTPVAATSFALVNARAGASPARLRSLVLRDDPGALVLKDQRPSEVTSYQHLERTPLALAGLLVLLAIATMVHLFVNAVRHRRRELSLLRALGFTAAQLRVAVLVQATTLMLLSLVVAIPTGVVGGRLLWDLTSHGLGIPVIQVVPVLEIALVAIVALVVGNISALVPAISAGRVDPAESLRSE